MNVETEKATVLSQLEQVEDLELILAIKHLLDYGLRKEPTDPAFTAALERAIRQSEQGDGRAHQLVKQDFRNRYSA